jgi:TRAP transporter TAXI family solute receptor
MSFLLVLPIHSSEAKQFISFGTATEGGLFYVLGGGWAKIMNKALPDIEVTAEATGGSTANVGMMERGKIELGMILGQVTYDTIQEKKGKNLRTLFAAYPGYVYVYALKKSGLRTIYDISSKEIGYVKSVHDIALRMFEPLGIKPAKTHILTHAAVVEALADGVIHCSIVPGPEKWPGLTSLEASHEVQFLTMTPTDIQAILKILRAHTKGAVPKGAYKATAEKPYETIVDWILVLANKTLSEDVAYRLVKTTFENNAALQAVHPVAKMTTPENALNSPIPLHPGTVKYLKERKIQIPENLIPKD